MKNEEKFINKFVKETQKHCDDMGYSPKETKEFFASTINIFNEMVEPEDRIDPKFNKNLVVISNNKNLVQKNVPQIPSKLKKNIKAAIIAAAMSASLGTGASHVGMNQPFMPDSARRDAVEFIQKENKTPSYGKLIQVHANNHVTKDADKEIEFEK